MKKRIFAVLTVCVFMVVFCAVTLKTQAAATLQSGDLLILKGSDGTAYVNTESTANQLSADYLSSFNISYSSGKWVFNGAVFSLIPLKGITFIGDTTLELSGNNEFNFFSTDPNKANEERCIDCTGHLTIQGSGNLKVSGNIYTIKSSELTLKGTGTLTLLGGGYGIYSSGDITMESGTITGIDHSDATRSGKGSIYVEKNKTFTMSGGTIKNCKAKNGGAVYVASGGSFNMNGGSIENCTATENGGAVYLEKDANLYFDSCSIQQNKASKNGGGIYAAGASTKAEGGELCVQSEVLITKNTVSEKAENLYLGKNRVLKLTPDSTPSDSIIGLTMEVPGDFAAIGGCTVSMEDLSENFTSDKKGIKVNYQEEVNTELLVIEPRLYLSRFPYFEETSVTKTYGDEAFTNKVVWEGTDVVYSIDKEEVATIDAATGEVTIMKAGTATVTATVAKGNTYEGGQVTYSLEVSKLENGYDSFTCADISYGEIPDSIMEGAKYGTVSYSYSTSESGPFGPWSTENSAGKYYVKAEVKESATYTGISKILSFEVKMAVVKRMSNGGGRLVNPQELIDAGNQYQQNTLKIVNEVAFESASTELTGEEKNKIQAAIGNKNYLAWSTSIFVKTEGNGSYTDFGNQNSTIISVAYSFDSSKKQNIQVLRIHSGQAEELTETANENGESAKNDSENNEMIVKAGGYSIYVIAYDEIPETGDSSNVWLYLALAVLSLGAILFKFNSKRQ